MLIQSSPLGAQIANLQTAIAARETCAWLPATLHAMIAAIFARIFGRLEQILLLWQSGNLPLPQTRSTAPRASRRDSACGLRPPVPLMPRPVRRSPQLVADRRTCAEIPQTAAVAQVSTHALNPTPLGARPPSLRPRHARDPPPPNSRNAPKRCHANTPILLRYQNYTALSIYE